MRRFYSRVLSSRIRVGVRAGLVAAAATAGAIIGFGIRHNDWSGPFVSLGVQLMHGFGITDPPRFLTVTVGTVAHLSWMVLWGITFAALAHRRSPAISAAFAVLVGICATLVAWALIPAALGAVTFAGMPGVQAALCLVLMCAGLVTGRALSSD